MAWAVVLNGVAVSAWVSHTAALNEATMSGADAEVMPCDIVLRKPRTIEEAHGD